MSVYDVNNEVDQITQAYKKKFGFSPKPSLIYDVLKARHLTGPVDYTHLFSLPSTRAEATAALTARSFGGDPIATLPMFEPDAKTLVRALKDAIKADQQIKGSYKQFLTSANTPDASPNATNLWKQYKDAFESALNDPKESEILVKGLMEVAPWNPMAHKLNPTYTKELAQEHYARFKLAELKASGIVPPKGTLGLVGKAMGQIGVATTNMPFGFYEIVRSLGLDLYDNTSLAVHVLSGDNPVSDLKEMQAHHTLNLAVQMGKSVWEDVTNPTERPGYLAMDLWGFGTGAAGIASRVSRGTLRGLSPAATEMGYKIPRGEESPGLAVYSQSLPLSDTAIVRFLQLHTPIVGRVARQARLAAEQTDGYDRWTPERLVDEYMSTPAMLRRARQGDLKIKMAIDLTPLVEMVRLTQWDQVAKDVYKEVGWKAKDWKGVALKHKLGVQKAIQLIMSDDPDPVGTWRAFHEHQLQAVLVAKEGHLSDRVTELIESSDGDITPDEAVKFAVADPRFNRRDRQFEAMYQSHKAQLEAIELAKDIILNPSARFEKLLNRAYEVSRLQQRWKGEVSGFPEWKFDQHVAEVMGKVRGEHIIDMGDGTKGVAPYPVAHLFTDLERVDRNVAESKSMLNKAERNERIAPGTMTQELARARKNLEGHEAIKAALEEKIDKARAESRPLEKVVGENGKINSTFLRRHVEDLAKQFDVSLRWGEGRFELDRGLLAPYLRHGGHRGDNSIIPVVDRGQLAPSSVADIDQVTDMAAQQETVLRDTKHNRDNTNNYLGALHEIGHNVWEKFVKADDASLKWEVENNPNAEQLMLEEEAFAWRFSLQHSVEPLRSMVAAQARTFLNTYENAYREGKAESGVRHIDAEGNPVDLIGDTLGPAYHALAQDLEQTAYGDALADLRQGTPGSAYSGPLQPEKYRGSVKDRIIGGNRTRFGLRPVDFPIKAWTGKSLEMGDFRWDVTNLLAEQMHFAYKAVTRYIQWRDLWNAAVETPLTSRHRPIRDVNTIPDELRKFVELLERSQLDHRFADIATEGKMAELGKLLYPREEDVRSGAVPHEHVRYVDEHLILDKVGNYDTQFWATLNDALTTGMAPINEPMRLALIFATPAYALGSTALLMIRSGHLTPKYLGRSWFAHRHWSPEEIRLLDRLAGETHASALVAEMNKFTRGSQALQNFWGVLTDRYFRRAAVLHELDRHGLLEGNLLENLTDPKNQKKISQAAQQARKTMLDFNSLTWPERAVMRHLFFVYSFVRASGVWSLRYLRDHGLQADVLAKAGDNRDENIKELIGEMPSWFMRSGYFAVHPDTIYNPIQWNMPGMLEQIGTPLSAIFGDTPYSSAAELWGPATTFIAETATGVDPQGRKLPHSDKLAQIPGLGGSAGDALLSLYKQTFLGQIKDKEIKSAKQKEQPLKPEPVESSFLNPISSALQRERSGLNQSVFDVDGFWNTWGLALFRSALPRGVNDIAGEARYWRDLRESDPQAYHQHERDMVNKMIKRQEKVVGEAIPGEALRAVDTVAHVSQAIEDWKLKHKGEAQPNQKQITLITIQTLASEGHIDAKKWTKRLNQAVDPTEVNSIRMEALYASGAKAWKDWVTRVQKINEITTPKFEGGLAKLKELGLGTYTAAAPNEAKWDYGRQYLSVLEKSHEIADRVASLTGNRQATAQQEWINFVNENDHEIVVNGHTFPSPFAYQYATKTDKERHRAVVSWAKKKPSEMTALQAQILTGTRPSPEVVRGWHSVYNALAKFQAALPFGKSLPAGSRVDIENQVAAKLPEFKKALQFERLPLAARMQTYGVVKSSPNAAGWNWLLRQAVNVYKVGVDTYKTESGTVNQHLVHELWRRQALPQVIDTVKTSFPGLTSELRLYTGATSDANADEYLSKFLARLVDP
jgi:hypothetical protein